jgi:hypothetical protein
MENKKQLVVVDLFGNTNAEQAERLLNDVLERGYYIFAAHPGEGGGSRVFFNARRNLPLFGKSGPKGNSDGKDDAAFAYIAQNCSHTCAALVEELEAMGIVRKTTWTYNARAKAKRAASNGDGNRPQPDV